MNKRIEKLRKTLKLTKEEFGKKIGADAETVSKLEAGETSLSVKMNKAICREFNVDYIWLTMGEGNMFFEELAFLDWLEEDEEKIELFKQGIFKMLESMDKETLKNLYEEIKVLVENEKTQD